MITTPPRPAGRRAHAASREGVAMRCAGCDAVVPPHVALPTSCPGQVPGDDVDHLLGRELPLSRVRLVAADDPNPFVRYRQMLRAWHVAVAAGWTDARFVALVRQLDGAVASVDGAGFRVTPTVRDGRLSDALGFARDGGVWIKDETRHVGGSHKARHLMGVMLELLVAETLEPALRDRRLAIASCGNAALAAAVVARAAARPLDVFVPPDADPAVMQHLAALGADVRVVARAPGERGDPTVREMRVAVCDGAIPFTCQGPENGLAIEGGMTLGYELAEASAALLVAGERPLARLIVQVGGGALASACVAGLDEAARLGAGPALPRLDTVQTTGAWPLERAYDRIAAELDAQDLDTGQPLDDALPAVAAALDRARRHRSGYMWPWESEPHSVAHGILDDETYDWLAVVRGMLATGGHPVCVTEAELVEAAKLARNLAGIDADETGAAGLAGVLHLRRRGAIRADERVAVLLTGARRTATPRDPMPSPVIERRTSG